MLQGAVWNRVSAWCTAALDLQEALVTAVGVMGSTDSVGVYVGCMWAHEYVEALPQLVRSSRGNLPDESMAVVMLTCTMGAGHIRDLFRSQHGQHLSLHGGPRVVHLWPEGAVRVH